ncbi:MAG: carboxypeptidase-like regulatory domain-containing protein [Bacteroidota bacterium]|nr:carboxypeptidase-like regulatory domain-containing protein [Bacteroidota bacterium]
MKRYKYIISLLCIVIFISCESDKLDIVNYGTISGVVLDAETYLPVPGVLVTTTPASDVVLSDANGKFTIQKVLEGDVAVNIKKKDYLSNSLSVAIYENQNTQMNFLIFKDDANVGTIFLYDPVPGNGAVDQNLAITFNWKVEGNNANIQLTYNIYIFESNSTVQQLLGENVDLMQVTTNGLKLSTTYYWYVVAKYQGTKVAVSPTWSFKTKDK